MPYKDPEARRAKNRAYLTANREKVNAYARAYRIANLENMKAKNRAYLTAARQESAATNFFQLFNAASVIGKHKKQTA